jgi:hypothetical protein
MVAFGGASPVQIEYTLDLPQEAEYTLSFRYSAQQARPVRVSLGDRDLGEACRSASGSWSTKQAKWEALPPVRLAKGPHRLRQQRDGDFPHLMEIRVECAAPWPSGWKPPAPALTLAQALARVPSAPREPPNFTALRLAVRDLLETHGAAYARGAEFLARLDTLEREHQTGDDREAEFTALRRVALLANPALSFSDVLLVRRPAKSPSTGLPRNWQGNCSLPKKGYDDALCRWSLRAPETPHRRTARRGQLRRLLPARRPHRYASSAGFIGVPCVNGSDVANLFVMDADGKNIRRVCFDQEHNWCPTVMNDGRVLYARWEYTDTPHSNTRLLFP